MQAILERIARDKPGNMSHPREIIIMSLLVGFVNKIIVLIKEVKEIIILLGFGTTRRRRTCRCSSPISGRDGGDTRNRRFPAR
jgi:hypothetical protein